jgi:hypothetical protein
MEISDILPVILTDDDSIPEGYPLKRFYALLDGPEFCGKYNWNLNLSEDLPDMLRGIGFADIHQQRRRLPLGRWARQPKQRLIGILYAEVLLEFVIAVLVKFKDLGLTRAEAQQLGDECRRCVNDPAIHAYMGWFCVWAQKPSSTGR